MKKLFFTILFSSVLSAISASAQKIELSRVIIDKDAKTITHKVTGKTFKLSGTYKIVDSYADFEVKIVDSYPDIEVKLTEEDVKNKNDIDTYPDVTIKIVDSYPDIEIKIVDSYPSIRRY